MTFQTRSNIEKAKEFDFVNKLFAKELLER